MMRFCENKKTKWKEKLFHSISVFIHAFFCNTLENPMICDELLSYLSNLSKIIIMFTTVKMMMMMTMTTTTKTMKKHPLITTFIARKAIKTFSFLSFLLLLG